VGGGFTLYKTVRAIHHYAAKCAMNYIGFGKGDFFSAFFAFGAINRFRFVAVAADFCCYFFHVKSSVRSWAYGLTVASLSLEQDYILPQISI